MVDNVLVTGAAGFIGTNFVYYWLKSNPEDNLFGLDDLTYAGIRENLDEACLEKNFKFIKGDIKNKSFLKKIFEKYKINKVIHFAAESHVDRSIINPEIFINTNIIGTFNLLEVSRNYWQDNSITNHHFHHISTDEVYGDLTINQPSFTESNQYLPNSPYAASKAASDHLVRAFNKTFSIKTTISNCSNNYGPYQFPEKLIPVIIISILKKKKIPIYGDGMQIRDWLHVSDHCRGIELIIKKGINGETYNIGTDNEIENINLVRKICDLVDKNHEESNNSNILISHVQDRLGHDRRYSVDANKISSKLGFKTIKTFDKSLEETVNWYLSNISWWKKLIK